MSVGFGIPSLISTFTCALSLISLFLSAYLSIFHAGFGGHGTVVDREVADDVNMIMVNVVAATVLVKLFAKDMVELGGGKILNVGSTAGFLPGPYQAVYFATKAYGRNHSQTK